MARINLKTMQKVALKTNILIPTPLRENVFICNGLPKTNTNTIPIRR